MDSDSSESIPWVCCFVGIGMESLYNLDLSSIRRMEFAHLHGSTKTFTHLSPTLICFIFFFNLLRTVILLDLLLPTTNTIV
jgi:F0F1-type ATP synthase membrane subunit a